MDVNEFRCSNTRRKYAKTMKILLDLEDRPYLLQQLFKLYCELPVDLRSQKSLLPASELILEATEYISLLKKYKTSSSNSSRGKNESDKRSEEKVSEKTIDLTQKFNPHLVVSGLGAKYDEEFRENGDKVVAVEEEEEEENVENDSSIRILPSSSTSSISSSSSQSIVKSVPTAPPTTTTPTASSSLEVSLHSGPCRSECKCNRALVTFTQKLMRFCVVGHDPSMESHNVHDRNYYSAAVGYLFHRKSNADLNRLLSILTRKYPEDCECFTLDRATTGHGTISFGGIAGSSGRSAAYPHELFYRCWRNNSLTSHERLFSTSNCRYGFREQLRLICINPYHYKEEEDIQQTFIRTLRRCSTVNLAPERSFWRREAVQTEFYNILSEITSDEEKMTIIRGVDSGSTLPENRNRCFKVERRRDSMKDGEIKIQQCKEFVQHVMFRMFRGTYRCLGQIAIQSTSECLTSQGLERARYLCLNPWHFEEIDVSKNTKKHLGSNHRCQPRVRITLTCVRYMCFMCEEDITEPQEVANVFVKSEAPDPLPDENGSYDGLADVADALSLEIKVEEDEDGEGGEDPSSSIVTESKTLKNSEERHPVSQRERSTRKRKLQPIFQCWKCLLTFTTNSDLESHVCENKNKGLGDDDDEDEEDEVDDGQEEHSSSTSSAASKKFAAGSDKPFVLGDIKEEILDDDDDDGDDDDEESSGKVVNASENGNSAETTMMYTCQFCGSCSPDLQELRGHAVKCKELGLQPLLGLIQMSGAHHRLMEESQDSRSGNLNASQNYVGLISESANACSYCCINFADAHELKLHSGKRKCKSIQCSVCNKFYANTRTHQSHACDGLKLKNSDGIIRFKVDKSSGTSLPVECEECGLLVQSKHILKQHRSVQKNMCTLCNTEFSSVCKILRHPCLKDYYCNDSQKPSVSNFVKLSGKPVNVVSLNDTVSCAICGKIFINSDALQLHKKSIHRTT